MTPSDGARAHFLETTGIIIWTSFLAACVETMGFFAFIDPGVLATHPLPAWAANRLAGYTVGFFFFWAFTLIASVLTAYLLDTRKPRDPS